MSFAVPAEGDADPRPILQRLIANESQFEKLAVAKADILVLMRLVPKVKAGRVEMGSMAIPGWQGSGAQLGMWLLAQFHEAIPDFIMVLDQEWWSEASAHAREALVFHELMHADQAKDKEGEERFDDEGMPVWCIRAHDIEEFHEVARRYPRAFPDTQDFILAATAGRNDR